MKNKGAELFTNQKVLSEGLGRCPLLLKQQRHDEAVTFSAISTPKGVKKINSKKIYEHASNGSYKYDLYPI